MSLSELAQKGLRDLPTNAAWLFDRALGSSDSVGSAAEHVAARARDTGQRLSAAVVHAAPGGDPVESLMKRAQQSAERAREAEVRAVESSEEAKARAEYAHRLNAQGRTRLKEVEREISRERDQRIKQAEKEAEAALRREREAAEADAEKRRREVFAEVEDETESARRDAEDSQHRAEECVEDAREKLAEAKRLADEAAQAARAAAEKATRHAQQLSSEAEQQAEDAEARVAAAEQIQTRSEATVMKTARDLERESANGDLDSYNKQELIELAASMSIAGRSHMTKPELVKAIRRTPGAPR